MPMPHGNLVSYVSPELITCQFDKYVDKETRLISILSEMYAEVASCNAEIKVQLLEDVVNQRKR